MHSGYDLWLVFFFKQKTAYDMRISDWSSDVVLFRSDERHRKAVKDLAAQSDEIEQRRKEKESLERDYKLRGELLTSARAEIAALRPDAEIGRASCTERVCQYV